MNKAPKFLMITIWLACSTLANASNDRPNFLFIIVDDLGWADIGVNDSAFYETPNIDRLASEGLLFTEGYVSKIYF